MSSVATRSRIFDAARQLIVVRGEAVTTMAEIAKKAKISRQALYLHFADRAALLDALVDHVDERRDLAGEIQKILDAPCGRDAIHRLVHLQATHNAGIWPVALAFEAIRRTDPAAQRSWQQRQTKRISTCRAIVDRLRHEGDLRAELSVAVATDLLYVMTSLRTWEDLVLGRGWTADIYEERVTGLLIEALTISGRAIVSPIGRGRKQPRRSTKRPA
jgi:AcrR family transcriptional regulator